MRATTAGAALVVAALLTAGCSSEVDRPIEAHVMVGPEAPAPPAGDIDEGGPLYVTTCAACHGDEGQGGFGPNLQTSLVAADFDALIEQITNGQGDMPAFDSSLSSQQIDDVGAYVNARIVEVGKKPVAAVTPQSGRSPSAVPSGIDTAAGAQLFARTCASCHGPDGKGTDIGPAIPPDLGFADTVAIVMGGAQGMPAFAQFLGAEEVNQVTAYVVSELSGPASSSPQGQ